MVDTCHVPFDQRNPLDEVLAHSEPMVTGRRYFNICSRNHVESRLEPTELNRDGTLTQSKKLWPVSAFCQSQCLRRDSMTLASRIYVRVERGEGLATAFHR